MCAWLVKSAEARGVASVLRGRFEGLAFSVTDGKADGVPVVSVFATAARFGGAAPVEPAEADDLAHDIYVIGQSATTREVRVLILSSDSSARIYSSADLGAELAREVSLALADSLGLPASPPPTAARLAATFSLREDDKAVLKLSGSRPLEAQVADVGSLYAGYFAELLRAYPAAQQTSSLFEYGKWASAQLLRASKRPHPGHCAIGDFEATLDYAKAGAPATGQVVLSLADDGVRITCPSGKEAHCLSLALCLFTRALCSPQMPPEIPAEAASALRQLLEATARGPVGE